jgi:hypothetical protein
MTPRRCSLRYHAGVVNTALLLYFYHHLDHHLPSTYLFVFGMFRPSDILTLFRFIYFVSRYLALGAYFLQTSAQSDLLIRRLVVRLLL